MTSLRKTSANQKNAQRSTGPRTEEGKTAIKFNALKHGLTAAQILLPDEDESEFQRFMKAMNQQLQPNGPLEQELSDAIATRLWRLRRVPRIEAETLRYQTRTSLLYNLDQEDPIGQGFLSDCRGPDALLKLSRYETALHSQLLTLIREFRELREHTEHSGFVSQSDVH